jgi:hypothetical protein
MAGRGLESMAKPNYLNVYLLNVEPPNGRPVFYAEPPEDVDEASTKHRGLRGWAEANYRRIKDRWEHSHGLVASLGRRFWGMVNRRKHPDERLLAHLRSVRSIEVHYPATSGLEETGAAWSKFLAAARRRHWAWFAGNALVCPLTLLLMPLPGPNLIGYWFVYRAVHHWLILVGIGRVRRGHAETFFRPGDDLASPDGLPGDLDAAAVGGFLKRHGVVLRDRARDCEPPGSEALLTSQGP